MYINLDSDKVKLTESRDRFRGDHAKLLAQIKKELPGMMIHAYLKRVLDINDAADLTLLPREYFIEAYRLADPETLKDVTEDARKINAGENAIDYGKYNEPDGRKLLKLLTLIRFIPDPDHPGKKMTLQELYDRQDRAEATGSDAIDQALSRGKADRGSAEANYAPI